MLALEVQNAAAGGKRIRIRSDLCIGAAEECSIRAQHADMKAVHARFSVDGTGRVHVEVADQDAHIFVNGRDVLRSELRHQDHLAVGPLRFRIVDENLMQRTTRRLDELLSEAQEPPRDIYDFATEDLFYLTNKDPSLRQGIAFKIPSKDRFIEQAQQFLARLIRQSEMDEMRIEAFMTCTKELILNAHRHGHQYDESKTIIIRYNDLGDRCSLSIEDEGPGFDHQKLLEEVRALSAAEAARKRYQAGGFGGLGFQMITRMAETIEYNELGNIVTFTVLKAF